MTIFTERNGLICINVYDADLNLIPYDYHKNPAWTGPSVMDEIYSPQKIADMKETALRIAANIDLDVIRVDLYHYHGKFYASEATFSPNGGNPNFRRIGKVTSISEPLLPPIGSKKPSVLIGINVVTNSEQLTSSTAELDIKSLLSLALDISAELKHVFDIDSKIFACFGADSSFVVLKALMEYRIPFYSRTDKHDKEGIGVNYCTLANPELKDHSALLHIGFPYQITELKGINLWSGVQYDSSFFAVSSNTILMVRSMLIAAPSALSLEDAILTASRDFSLMAHLTNRNIFYNTTLQKFESEMRKGPTQQIAKYFGVLGHDKIGLDIQRHSEYPFFGPDYVVESEHIKLLRGDSTAVFPLFYPANADSRHHRHGPCRLVWPLNRSELIFRPEKPKQYDYIVSDLKFMMMCNVSGIIEFDRPVQVKALLEIGPFDDVLAAVEITTATLESKLLDGKSPISSSKSVTVNRALLEQPFRLIIDVLTSTDDVDVVMSSFTTELQPVFSSAINIPLAVPLLSLEDIGTFLTKLNLLGEFVSVGINVDVLTNLLQSWSGLQVLAVDSVIDHTKLNRIAAHARRCKVLKMSGIEATKFKLHETVDAVYFNSLRDYNSLMANMQAWWPVLISGGVLIGCDYFVGVTNSDDFVTAAAAVVEFTRKIEIPLFQTTNGGCWYVIKP